ncbi:hypothetical protein DKT77_10285 [Meridianimarinicoccus roseus]|uniref:Uncharacterized protein n=1 Tax=Meridianimarinicoccus roseus TaxID=2072018 RepID=A0A2V2LGE5_9RHOB|nr:hypothetical protein [Meridianimarinicoccus roseus]PWR02574.1 hypothetical protein DKT77_10285 [Meridianimarinicoccus roseus]
MAETAPDKTAPKTKTHPLRKLRRALRKWEPDEAGAALREAFHDPAASPGYRRAAMSARVALLRDALDDLHKVKPAEPPAPAPEALPLAPPEPEPEPLPEPPAAPAEPVRHSKMGTLDLSNAAMLLMMTGDEDEEENDVQGNGVDPAEATRAALDGGNGDSADDPMALFAAFGDDDPADADEPDGPSGPPQKSAGPDLAAAAAMLMSADGASEDGPEKPQDDGPKGTGAKSSGDDDDWPWDE